MMTVAPVKKIEDCHYSEDEQSPTDSSEDSVEVKVHPILAPRQRQASPNRGAKRSNVCKRKLQVDIISTSVLERKLDISNVSVISERTMPTSFSSDKCIGYNSVTHNERLNESIVCSRPQNATVAVVPKKRRLLCEVKTEIPSSSDITQYKHLSEIVPMKLPIPTIVPIPCSSSSTTSSFVWPPSKDHNHTPNVARFSPEYLKTSYINGNNPMPMIKSEYHSPIPIETNQDEPLSLVTKRDKSDIADAGSSNSMPRWSKDYLHPNQSIMNCDRSQTPPKTTPFSMESLLQPTCQPSDHQNNQTDDDSSPLSNRQKQRNYKNMTRERRIEANARERTRVHTISAAFDALRDAIPSYSHNQKLSKLSILKIASSYILTLGRLAGYDLSVDNSAPSIPSCVETLTQTIQSESKVRKRKDE